MYCPDNRPAKLLVFTDEPQLALGVSHLLSSVKEFEVIPANPQVEDLLPLIEKMVPDIILVDLAPEMTLTLFARIRERAPRGAPAALGAVVL